MKTRQKKPSGNYSYGAMALLAGSSCLLSSAAWAAPLVNTEGLKIGDNVSIDANENSAAFGSNTTASGPSSVAFGDYTTARGWHSAAFGDRTTASNDESAAFGYVTTASGKTSVAFGIDTTASGQSSAAFGFSTIASGDYSVAFGTGTTAQPMGSVVIGRYNVISGTTTNWIETDPLFVIGNGSSSSNRHNALTALKNGDVGIGTATPEVELDVYGSVAFGGDANDTVQFGDAGRPFAAMRVGKYDVGSSSSNIKTVTVTFGQTFSVAPLVTATAAGERTWNNVFAVTVRSVTTTGFVAVIKRLDNTTLGWGQNLDLGWQAYEL
uniref:Head domain of trimeric autotransporter adhesin n=1 Tax=Candidatus Kentrum sp. UNK TaxID=2126344 RepID=A0A451B1R8_9GAMM|nr:MAG: Head domain of trimeric autotransporter adhesin [Candidatus Kentron sp. UNK]VFK72229.1 MAG: Head domain of trimeric autotransporter adhesin [Candidatus Kentron sp. UNK]